MPRSRLTTMLPTPLREPVQKRKGKSRYRPCFDERQAIFIHIPKAAGQSVSRVLFGIEGPGHHSIRDYIWENPRKFEQYFKFTFTRNPWDRLVSAYHYLTHATLYVKDQRFGRYLNTHYPDFNRFVTLGFNDPIVTDWVHIRPQYLLITNKRDELVMDFIGHYENLNEDFTFIADKLGVNAELPRVNSSTHSDYRRYYDDFTAARVAEYYARDIALLNYGFDPDSAGSHR